MFLITVLHVTVCLALIIIVLLQAGKGADIGASLGGAGSQTLFGTSGTATMISKITTGIAILFMVTSLTLAYSSGKTGKSSVIDAAKTTSATTAPAADTKPAPIATEKATEKTSTEAAPAATPAADK